FTELVAGNYRLAATYVGYATLVVDSLTVVASGTQDLGVLHFPTADVALDEITVTATRSLLEVKADRTVFNVAGTINGTGSDAIGLLRKAPGVVVGNNDNISVLGRAGVLLYVDGKRLPFTGRELADYLRNLPADQIDRIEIITSPGAEYEAEGNGGIIDIRLKREENLGFNGSATLSYGQGRYGRMSPNLTASYRSKRVSLYGNLGHSRGAQYSVARFSNTLNGFQLEEVEAAINHYSGYFGRLGMDFFLGEEHTLGILVSGRDFAQPQRGTNRNVLAGADTPELIDSILVSTNTLERFSRRQQINLNYRYAAEGGRVLNFDVDYSIFKRGNVRHQDNQYFDPTEQEAYSASAFQFHGPTTVSVAGVKLDVEQPLPFGRLTAGAKLSQIASDNAFLVYDGQPAEAALDTRRSSTFSYLESIQAAYVSLNGKLSEQLEYSVGLRKEWTQIDGEIGVFAADLSASPVRQRYRRWFPNAGLSWSPSEVHTLGLRYGRRIARPFYGLLSPFRNQLSPLTFSVGNPRLQPEQINNLELAYTLAQRYHLKLAYGRTDDQITHVTRQDVDNPLARSFSSDNSARQHVFSLSLSLPLEVTPAWTTTTNFNAQRLRNFSRLSAGESLSLRATSFSCNHQSTVQLPQAFRLEVSGYYHGPGIRGGDVFRLRSNWNLDLGVQRKFLAKQLTIRLAVSDLFHQNRYAADTEFNGIRSVIMAKWDSRRLNVNLNYTFGNHKVKSRNRRTGTASETGRIG
ncbi:MAG: TonB-dependent receptor, partial [Bacteroidota bacterium]